MKLDDLNSHAFVFRLKSGDDEAFSKMYSSLFPKICNILKTTYSLSDPNVEELTSDALIKVRDALSTFNPNLGAKLTTWVVTIARNTAIDFLRKKLKEDEKFMVVGLDDAKIHESEVVIADEWQQQNLRTINQSERGESKMLKFLKAFNSLSEEDQNILRLKSCLEYNEIAIRENTSVGALRTRHSRAQERLRNKIAREEIQ